MRAMLKAVAYATLLALPGHWIAPAYQAVLLGLSSFVIGRELAPPGDGYVDLSAANLLTIFVALCLASDFAPWGRRFRAMARGIPLLIVVECASGIIGMRLGVVGEASGVLGIRWHGALVQLLELSRWLAVPLTWGGLLGQFSFRWEVTVNHRTTSMTILVSLLAAQLLLPAEAQAIIFHGADTTPVGSTTLTVSDSLLQVSGMSASGLDGVNIVPPANCTGYTTLFDFVRINPGGHWTLSAFSGTQVTSLATARRVGPDSTRFEAGFVNLSDTGTVRVSAYLNGSLVRSILMHPSLTEPASLTVGSPTSTHIVPIILLVAVVIGILSDVKEYHIFLPNDPPGVYTVQTEYTFLGFTPFLAQPATGHLSGDTQVITFDRLVVAPVVKTSAFPYVSKLAYSGSDVQAYRMGSAAFSSDLAPTALPGSSFPLALAAGIGIALMGGWVILRRRRASGHSEDEGSVVD